MLCLTLPARPQKWRDYCENLIGQEKPVFAKCCNLSCRHGEVLNPMIGQILPTMNLIGREKPVFVRCFKSFLWNKIPCLLITKNKVLYLPMTRNKARDA